MVSPRAHWKSQMSSRSTSVSASASAKSGPACGTPEAVNGRQPPSASACPIASCVGNARAEQYFEAAPPAGRGGGRRPRTLVEGLLARRRNGVVE